jgi:hypothetical protein
MNYDYQKDIDESCKLISNLEGAVLNDFLVNIVEPEFNVVFLDTNKGVFALQGEVGGEYLGIRILSEMPSLVDDQGYIICHYPPFQMFVGKTIGQARHIGTAWNGHGFEITFIGMAEKSMIIQSIYSSPKPEKLEDCLKLGIGNYEYVWNKT